MIALREVKPDDRDIIRTWRNLPEVSRYMYTDHYITPEEHSSWFEGIFRDKTRRYRIIVADSEDVGLVNLYDINSVHRRCYWAFYLASSSVRGKGVGSSVEYAILRMVFDEMGFNKLCCEVIASNEPVIRMHESFGFVREGYFHEHVIKGSGPVDVVALAMLRGQWENHREAVEKRLREKGLL